MATAAPILPIRLGAVSFVNTLPLIDGLECLDDLDLQSSVPSQLIHRLEAGEVDAALCSSIDLARATEPVVVLPAGLLGCDGPTLTVRLFASRPLATLERICCDTDSHTSVVLLRILLRDQFEIDPEIIPFDARRNAAPPWPDAMLLIGDKVVTNATPAVRYPHQLDLGAAWRERTGLPFVFALWLGLAGAAPDRLRAADQILDRQRRANALRIDSIVSAHAEPRGWPLDLAREYLTERITYEPTFERREGLQRFLDLAWEHRLIDHPATPRWLDE